ncbi:MAG: helix-turn-helix domain-containing protein [Bryobacterales bacterium]|nr:helix-turn-helix domain-containing protein [Bryobacterales bacterium]
MGKGVWSRLGDVRRSRGITAADLARRVGVSRQTIHAIEGGSYLPNTEVTLKLARELEVPVEELFALEPEASAAPGPVRTEILATGTLAKGQPVQVVRVGERLVSVPVPLAPYFLPEADGILTAHGRAAGKVELALPEDAASGRLLVAGCDPAIGLVAGMVARLKGAEVVAAPASSRQALHWLRAGKIHIAGTHLRDTDSGEFNLPAVRGEFQDRDATVVTFAEWEEGLVVAPGNPKGVDGVASLARQDVRLINRETGSGSRALLDRRLAEAGVPAAAVQGYERMAEGHLAASRAVWALEAEACVATRSAARAFGLEFIPLESERYDFVIRRDTLHLPAVQQFLEVLQKASLRRRLEVVAGYDTSKTGAVQM